MVNGIILEQHIVSTPGLRSGKPHISGTRITVSDVVLMNLRLGQSLEEIAGDYDLSLAAVHAAMTYYYDHRDEIEAEIATGLTYTETMKQKVPSLLQKKIEATNRA